MTDYSPVFRNGAQPFTAIAGAAITAGKILSVQADNSVAISTAATKAAAVGIAANDTPSGGRVTIWPFAPCVHEIGCPAGATYAHGVEAGDAGVAIDVAAVGTPAAAGSLIGIVLKTVAADAAAKVRFLGRG